MRSFGMLGMFVLTMKIESVLIVTVDLLIVPYYPCLTWCEFVLFPSQLCFHMGQLNYIICLFFSGWMDRFPTILKSRTTPCSSKARWPYEFGGTYVCDATNSIGTRSGLVEVNVTGKLRMLIWVIKCVCWCWESFNLGPGDCSSRNVSFVEVE